MDPAAPPAINDSKGVALRPGDRILIPAIVGSVIAGTTPYVLSLVIQDPTGPLTMLYFPGTSVTKV